MIKKIPIIKDYKIIAIEIGIVLGLLLVGGFLEAYLIETIDEPLIWYHEVLLSLDILYDASKII